MNYLICTSPAVNHKNFSTQDLNDLIKSTKLKDWEPKNQSQATSSKDNPGPEIDSNKLTFTQVDQLDSTRFPIKTVVVGSRTRSQSDGALVVKLRKGILKTSSDVQIEKQPKRRVSFVDTIGLKLEQIKLFEKSIDEPSPIRPPPVFVEPRKRGFVPYFSLSWGTSKTKNSQIYEALEDRKICLESFIILPECIFGTILVKNLSYEKRVFARRTMDKWGTHDDEDAKFSNSIDTNIDRFSFQLRFPLRLDAGTRLELAFGYEVPDGEQKLYWDNNCCHNYAFWYRQ